MAFTWVTKAHYRSQQLAGLQYVVLQLQQEVTRPKARFKSTATEKSGVNRGAIRCQHILVSCFISTLKD